ncbi:hypothetical protein D1871_07945 [Nakamurella silvestris]|nr:hypothetical protein D1871_07945 [Nakamurella silvestris]
MLDDQIGLLAGVARYSDQDLIFAREADHDANKDALTAGLKRLDLPYPFSYTTLMSWRGTWRSIGGYSDREQHIIDMAAPVRTKLVSLINNAGLVDTGPDAERSWSDLEEDLSALAALVPLAETKHAYKSIGVAARDLHIEVAKIISALTPSVVPNGQNSPKMGDFKSWLDLYLAAHASGSSNKELRSLMRQANLVAQSAAHSGKKAEAVASAQATILIVRVLPIFMKS